MSPRFSSAENVLDVRLVNSLRAGTEVTEVETAGAAELAAAGGLAVGGVTGGAPKPDPERPRTGSLWALPSPCTLPFPGSFSRPHPPSTPSPPRPPPLPLFSPFHSLPCSCLRLKSTKASFQTPHCPPIFGGRGWLCPLCLPPTTQDTQGEKGCSGPCVPGSLWPGQQRPATSVWLRARYGGRELGQWGAAQGRTAHRD